jgi:uncharacterized protein YlzI (FlbEa/FlbD family)
MKYITLTKAFTNGKKIVLAISAIVTIEKQIISNKRITFITLINGKTLDVEESILEISGVLSYGS